MSGVPADFGAWYQREAPEVARTLGVALGDPALAEGGGGKATTPSTTTPSTSTPTPTSNGKLAGLSAAGLSPAFDPDITLYTAPGDHDVVTVTATLADPHANLYIQSTKVNSGQPFKAWVGDGRSIDIVIYSDWTEIGRYTITRSN